MPNLLPKIQIRTSYLFIFKSGFMFFKIFEVNPSRQFNLPLASPANHLVEGGLAMYPSNVQPLSSPPTANNLAEGGLAMYPSNVRPLSSPVLRIIWQKGLNRADLLATVKYDRSSLCLFILQERWLPKALTIAGFGRVLPKRSKIKKGLSYKDSDLVHKTI